MTVDFEGLEEALVMFDRSKKLRAQESVAVRLRLHLIPFDTAKFPELAGAEFGMANKSGVLLLPETAGEGRFLFRVGLVATRDTESGATRFLGPYVHGTSGEEFLYLNWRKDGTPGPWLWRRKFSLQSLTWDELVEADGQGASFGFDATGRRAHDASPITWLRDDPGR